MLLSLQLIATNKNSVPKYVFFTPTVPGSEAIEAIRYIGGYTYTVLDDDRVISARGPIYIFLSISFRPGLLCVCVYSGSHGSLIT